MRRMTPPTCPVAPTMPILMATKVRPDVRTEKSFSRSCFTWRDFCPTFGDSGHTVEGMATYTHGHHESVLRSHRWRTAENSAAYLLPHLSSGATVLDIGCGPGTITADLAALV